MAFAFTPRSTPVGIHFGALETRILQLRGGPGRWRVAACASLPARGRTRHAEAAARLKPGLKALKLRQRDATLAMGGDAVNVSLVPVDEHSRPRLQALLQEAAARAVRDDEGVAYRCLKLATGGHEGGSLRDEYLLLAVGQSELRRCQEAVRALGLRPVGLEMNAFAVARALDLARPEAEQAWGFLHLGFDQGMFGVVDQGQVRFLKPLQVSGERLLGTLHRRLRRGEDQAPAVSELLVGKSTAEPDIAERGADSSATDSQVTTVLESVRSRAEGRAADILAALQLQAAALAQEIRACVRHFGNRFPDREVGDIRLTGFGAALPEVDHALGSALGMPVAPARPFTDLGIRVPDDILAEEAQWTATLGLALRGQA